VSREFFDLQNWHSSAICPPASWCPTCCRYALVAHGYCQTKGFQEWSQKWSGECGCWCYWGNLGKVKVFASRAKENKDNNQGGGKKRCCCGWTPPKIDDRGNISKLANDNTLMHRMFTRVNALTTKLDMEIQQARSLRGTQELNLVLFHDYITVAYCFYCLHMATICGETKLVAWIHTDFL
jgi:hypothetical protein